MSRLDLVDAAESGESREGDSGVSAPMSAQEEVMVMSEFEFSLVLEGLSKDAAQIDEFFAAGCDDATFGSVDSVAYAEFSRKAESAIDAISSAISDVEKVPGVRVLRVEPDDYVTMSEIAERLGRSREGVRLLITGERGSGDFPPPVSHLRSRNRLWRWSDVARWAGDAAATVNADIVAAINGALELRNRRDEIDPGLMKRIRRLAS